jgi:hypothetical protein
VSVLAVVLALAVIAAAVFVISAPLRSAARRRDGRDADGIARESAGADRHELEVARETKYREIKDAELDYRTGKLSREDYEAVDGALRGEAVEILDQLEGD